MMRVRTIAEAALLLTVLLVSTVHAVAQNAAAATAPAATAPTTRPELALGYSYMRSNAPPGGCTCFNLNGGNVTFAWPLKNGHFAVAGDFTAVHVGGVSSQQYGLTVTTYTAGARYQLRPEHSLLRPFGQVLIGLAHASGTLVDGPTAAVPNAWATFGANLGGGLDLRVNRRFSWRVVEVDYILTTFDNGSNNLQNNFRIGSDIVFHF